MSACSYPVAIPQTDADTSLLYPLSYDEEPSQMMDRVEIDDESHYASAWHIIAYLRRSLQGERRVINQYLRVNRPSCRRRRRLQRHPQIYFINSQTRWCLLCKYYRCCCCVLFVFIWTYWNRFRERRCHFEEEEAVKMSWGSDHQCLRWTRK